MAGSADRILTTHVGSLVRPDELLAFVALQQEGKPYDAALAEGMRIATKQLWN